MSLTDKINEDLKNAMRSKDEAALRALRSIKSALLLAKTEKGSSEEVTEDQEMKILQRLAKQRRESIDIYTTQNRDDLKQSEEQELKIIENYLPKQLSEEEVRAEIKKIIEETGAKSAAEVGKVMPLAMKQLGGKADGKMISTIARELLS
jgi:uncharacterized protein